MSGASTLVSGMLSLVSGMLWGSGGGLWLSKVWRDTVTSQLARTSGQTLDKSAARGPDNAFAVSQGGDVQWRLLKNLSAKNAPRCWHGVAWAGRQEEPTAGYRRTPAAVKSRASVEVGACAPPNRVPFTGNEDVTDAGTSPGIRSRRRLPPVELCMSPVPGSTRRLAALRFAHPIVHCSKH